MEHWRDRTEATVMQKLATQSHCIPETGIFQELQGAFSQLQVLCLDQKIDWLLQEGQIRGLTSDEKTLLQQLIANKQCN